MKTLVARIPSRDAALPAPGQDAKDLFSVGPKGSDRDVGATTREILVYISVGG